MSVCILGHARKAMECPACGGSDDLAWWRWYRTRTGSASVRTKVDEYLAARVEDQMAADLDPDPPLASHQPDPETEATMSSHDGDAPSVYPEVTIYVVRESTGKLAPVAAALGGISMPVLEGSFGFDPNGTRGTRAVTASLRFLVGGAGFVEVGGIEDVPELARWVES